MNELNKNKIKLINSLSKKKYRNRENLFICEGEKIFETLLSSDFKIKEVFAIKDFVEKNEEIKKLNYTLVSENELKKISELSTPQSVLALIEIPTKRIEAINFEGELTIVLDKIQDPGNLGTIIRLADWFGIKNIVCSTDTVDVYNPKVVQSTMGSIFSVNIFYTDLKAFFERHNNSPIYGTFMDGDSIYETKLCQNGFILMGNEANGISNELKGYVNTRLSIPTLNKTKAAESLNVAIATAIVCSEFLRR